MSLLLPKLILVFINSWLSHLYINVTLKCVKTDILGSWISFCCSLNFILLTILVLIVLYNSNIFILFPKKLCQDVTWALEITRTIFCIPNFHLDTNKYNIWIKYLNFLITWNLWFKDRFSNIISFYQHHLACPDQ